MSPKNIENIDESQPWKSSSRKRRKFW